MKISKRQLKKIIAEEKKRLAENSASLTATENLNDAMDTYIKSYLRNALGDDSVAPGFAGGLKATPSEDVVVAVNAMMSEIRGYINDVLERD